MNTIEIATATPQTVPRRFQFGPMTPETRPSNVVICTVLWSIIAYLLISHFIMMRVEIKGASMWPTLSDGQRYMLYRCPYLFRAPHRGEIVVIRDPEDHDLSIKRIIASPNETIEIRHDGVYVNDTKLPEPYLTRVSAYASGHKYIKRTVLGPKEYYVLGDNRDRSADSRIYGAIPRSAILGCISKPD